jgi:hypothetical protein
MRRRPLGKKIKETWLERTSAGNRASLRKYSPAYTNAVPVTINQILIKKSHTEPYSEALAFLKQQNRCTWFYAALAFSKH